MTNLVQSKDTQLSLAVALRNTLPETLLLERAILYTLAYGDVFDYPLTASEVHRYLVSRPATSQEVTRALAGLVESCAIVRVGEYFALPGRRSIMETRRRRTTIAVGLWRSAARYGRMLALLPFVRMVAVTGSLAMGNAESGKDIDLMLVTVPHRLWACRALVALVTRLAALQGVRLCPNYMVTTNALQFKECSLYVAHEVAQMIPLSGLQIYARIRSLNAWTDDYLPNASGIPQPFAGVGRSARWQRLLETVLTILPVEQFEHWEMKRKIEKLSREQSFSPEAYFSSDVCKGHADMHRQETEAWLHERLKGLESP